MPQVRSDTVDIEARGEAAQPGPVDHRAPETRIVPDDSALIRRSNGVLDPSFRLLMSLLDAVEAATQALARDDGDQVDPL